MAEGVEVDKASLRLLVHALRAEADGKELNRDLVRGLRAAAQPALVAVRGAVLSMPSKGLGAGPSLRSRVAAGTKIHVHAKGRKIGVSIAAHRRGMPRQFWKAPKYLNRDRPWRHPVFGNREVWVEQVSRRPGWFDDTLRTQRAPFLLAASHAMANIARRISAKTRG